MKTIVYKIRKYPLVSETFIAFNMVAAIEHGHQVEIVADQWDESQLGTQPHLEAQYQLAKRVRVPSSPLKFWSRWSRAFLLLLNPILAYYFVKYSLLKRSCSFKHLFTLHFYAALRRNTIFHVHFSNRAQLLFDLKKIGFLKSPVIITFHGFDVHRIPALPSASWERDDINQFAAAITTNTEYLREKAITRGIRSDLISVVPVGLDLSIFKPSAKVTPHSVIKIISVGRLVPIKGHQLGIEAVHSLVQSGHNVSYYIVGEGEQKETLQNQISALHLEERVRIVNFKSQAEIKALFEGSDIFLMPSTTDTDGRREAFGVVSLEAQAMGLPVVGFNCGGFPETLVPGISGFVVPDGNVALLAEKLSLLVQDASLREKMGQAGIVHVQTNFANDKTVQKYLKLYETM